jgi:hypothetical protein
MIKFKRVEAIPLSRSPAKVLIRWEISGYQPNQLVDLEFCVSRQDGGQNGRKNFQDVDIDRNPKTPLPEALNPVNIIPISTWIDGLDFPWHIDHSSALKDLTTQSNYIVSCRDKKTQELINSEMFTWDGDLDYVGLYIVDEHNFLLKDVTGVPAVVFQRRRGGIQCPKCFDPIQKKRLISHCTSCYGTNWVGGFFNPIDTFIDFNPNPKNAVVTNWGEIQQNETSCLISNFPNVGPGDVIRELRDNRMWRVVNVTQTEKRRCQMLQFTRLTEIKPGDIEYSLPNDERFQAKKSTELEDIKKKPEF